MEKPVCGIDRPPPRFFQKVKKGVSVKYVLSLLLPVLFGFSAQAQTNPLQPAMFNPKQVEQIGVFDDWTAYIYENKKEKVCYAASAPFKSSGEYVRRGDVFLIVSHRPKEELFDVLTVVAGYTYMPRSEPVFRVGKTKFSLFTHRDTAWTKNLRTDKEIAEAMNRGVRATLRGTSIENVETYDTFSLKGFNNAMETLNRLCRNKPVSEKKAD